VLEEAATASFAKGCRAWSQLEPLNELHGAGFPHGSTRRSTHRVFCRPCRIGELTVTLHYLTDRLRHDPKCAVAHFAERALTVFSLRPSCKPWLPAIIPMRINSGVFAKSPG